MMSCGKEDPLSTISLALERMAIKKRHVDEMAEELFVNPKRLRELFRAYNDHDDSDPAIVPVRDKQQHYTGYYRLSDEEKILEDEFLASSLDQGIRIENYRKRKLEKGIRILGESEERVYAQAQLLVIRGTLRRIARGE